MKLRKVTVTDTPQCWSVVVQRQRSDGAVKYRQYQWHRMSRASSKRFERTILDVSSVPVVELDDGGITVHYFV